MVEATSYQIECEQEEFSDEPKLIDTGHAAKEQKMFLQNGSFEECKVKTMMQQAEEMKKVDEFFPCGYCQIIYNSLKDFNEHKLMKHSMKHKNSRDWTDEQSYGTTSMPYYINTQIINTNPAYDPAFAFRVAANPKAVNAKAPKV